jgi:hypothetical protein
MALRVVGAGLGRTGTNSLKLGLEQLLGGPCYHMLELFPRPEQTPVWKAALRGEPVNYDALLAGFVATVDWPACAVWRELRAANPGAVVVLSQRRTPEEWWDSFERTILTNLEQPVPAEDTEWVKRREMSMLMMERFTPRWRERDGAIEAYRRHNDAVRAEVPAGELIEWRPNDGWAPLCAGLGLPVPDEPFPHVNRREEFRAAMNLDES